MSPDCKAGKHAACDGQAWDDTADDFTPCDCECHRERLIRDCSTWSGWCTDNDEVLSELAALGGFLMEVEHRLALDRKGNR